VQPTQDADDTQSAGAKAPIKPALALAALGIVFGDIGTSPLYAMQVVFSADHNSVQPNADHVYGIISLVAWSITIVVSYKYVLFVLRADHRGEGGILALATLIRRHTVDSRPKLAAAAAIAGVLGASLFFGDSVITPAMSVLSAIEGLNVAFPAPPNLVVPIALGILIALFVVQKHGTNAVGRAFGPIMLLWFATIFAMGLPWIIRDPSILLALSPFYAAKFLIAEPLIGFIALGAIVLSVTGAEALYADVGHFGRRPISAAWFFVVMPALIVCYLGQGAMILSDPQTIDNPFFRLAPEWSVIPLTILATIATVIASQSVISGTYSVARQAVRLGYLPNLTVLHTSKTTAGQIYLPLVNWVLLVAVVAVVAGFGKSTALAEAYGLAVTATLVLTTLLFATYAVVGPRWRWWQIALVVAPVLWLELSFLVAGSVKIFSGGWLPLLIAVFAITIMTTWQRGRQSITARRRTLEGSLHDVLRELASQPINRIPGTAVYPHGPTSTAPLALRVHHRLYGSLFEHIVIVRVATAEVPHVEPGHRLTVDPLKSPVSGITHVTIHFGFTDERDVPAELDAARDRLGLCGADLDEASYFLSSIDLQPKDARGLAKWRANIFIILSKLSVSPARSFHLPLPRTVELRTAVVV